MIAFASSLFREGADRDVTVRARVESYASAIGAPPEMRDRYAGQLEIGILSVMDAETGAEVTPTASEFARLLDEAAEAAREARR